MNEKVSVEVPVPELYVAVASLVPVSRVNVGVPLAVSTLTAASNNTVISIVCPDL